MTNTTNSDIAVSVNDVHKEFILPQNKNSTFKQTVVNIVKQGGKVTQKTLDGVSFDVQKGDFFGIVGRNGSGKSTLLKLIAGVYTPTSGSIQTNGSLTPFIELGVGFNPELSGRDNVYLNGALLGFTRKQTAAMYDEIVAFAELEEFMDQKLKNYSSGMQVRLAFSIAIRAEGDILVLDEVLAVGDEAFQRKCNDYFKSIKKSGKTVILVTHDMESVRKYCNKAIMISQGKIVATGSPDDVANEYSMENLSAPTLVDEEVEGQRHNSTIETFDVELLSSEKINQDDKVVIKYTVSSRETIKARIVTDVYNIDENYYLYCSGSPQKQLNSGEVTSFEVIFDTSPFNDMNIAVHSSLRNEDGDRIAFSNDKDSPHFIIRRTDYGDKKQVGAVFMNGENVKWQ